MYHPHLLRNSSSIANSSLTSHSNCIVCNTSSIYGSCMRSDCDWHICKECILSEKKLIPTYVYSKRHPHPLCELSHHRKLHAECDICKNLNCHWCCTTCDWDMCVDCYSLELRNEVAIYIPCSSVHPHELLQIQMNPILDSTDRNCRNITTNSKDIVPSHCKQCEQSLISCQSGASNYYYQCKTCDYVLCSNCSLVYDLQAYVYHSDHPHPMRIHYNQNEEHMDEAKLNCFCTGVVDRSSNVCKKRVSACKYFAECSSKHTKISQDADQDLLEPIVLCDDCVVQNRGSNTSYAFMQSPLHPGHEIILIEDPLPVQKGGKLCSVCQDLSNVALYECNGKQIRNVPDTQYCSNQSRSLLTMAFALECDWVCCQHCMLAAVDNAQHSLVESTDSLDCFEISKHHACELTKPPYSRLQSGVSCDVCHTADHECKWSCLSCDWDICSECWCVEQREHDAAISIQSATRSPLVITTSWHPHVLQCTVSGRNHSRCNVCGAGGTSDWYCNCCDWYICNICLKSEKNRSSQQTAPTVVEPRPSPLPVPTAPPLPPDMEDAVAHTLQSQMEPGTNLCVVCLASPKTMTFIHANNTGHTCCCERCAPMFQGKPCPLCREPILLIAKIYS